MLKSNSRMARADIMIWNKLLSDTWIRAIGNLQFPVIIK